MNGFASVSTVNEMNRQKKVKVKVVVVVDSK